MTADDVSTAAHQAERTARRVVLVTGASRGAGKGIAEALGRTGAVVYVTGRTRTSADPASLPGTLAETAAEIDRRGGQGIALACDHRDDAQVAAVASRIMSDHGHLDVLVNNAYAVPDALTDAGPFWEKPLDLQQQFDVGLRSTYVMTFHAAPLLVADPARSPLVVNTSGYGSVTYLHGPAYGAVKAGIDKLTHDMAVDFRPFGVSVISIWLGLQRTERTRANLLRHPDRYGPGELGTISESPEFTGRVIDAVDRWPQKLELSGTALIGAELGAFLGVTDVDGGTAAVPTGVPRRPSALPLDGDCVTVDGAVGRTAVVVLGHRSLEVVLCGDVRME